MHSFSIYISVITSLKITYVEQRLKCEDIVILGSKANVTLWALLQCGLNSVKLEA